MLTPVGNLHPAAFRMKDGALHLAKMSAPLRFVWSWPDVDLADVEPTSVSVARDPGGRWFGQCTSTRPTRCRSRLRARASA